MADRRRTLFRRLISGDPSATSDAAAFLQSKLAESEKIVGHLMSKGGKSLAGLIGRFDATEAQRILDAEYSATLSAFDNYLARRKDGGARELLPSAGFAKIWLANSAPTKLVDGSWLQHCLASSTPPALSRFHAALFSIFADELGEGVLKQNHVTAFLDTLESAGVRLPRIDSPAFSSSPHLLSSAFDCALVQLSLSLFPESKLPEIIGYNLGYEQLPVHLLVSVHELEELGIDSTYFALHVSIDNHSSGHAKLAASCAWEYLEYVRAEFGEQEMQHHFHRILLGYHMNDLNPIKPQLARIRDMLQLLTASQATAPIDLLAIATNPKDLDRRRMLRILKEKARHGAQIHPPDSKLFGQSIRTLLSPPHPELDESFEPLLMALQKSRWIKPGRPEESPFLGMLCGYGGKMFGVFTREERGALEDWIRGLPTNSKDIDEVEDGMGGPETGVEDETGGRSMERSSAIATATDRINSVTAHLRFSTNHNSDTSLLARALPTSFEVPGPVLAAARSFLDSLFSSPTDISHSAFAQNSLSSRIMNSNLNPAILKLEGVLLDSFFVPALHPTPIGEALLKVRMAQGDYSRGMEGRPIWEIWGGVLARERIDTDTDSSELDEYKTYIHALSRHPQSHTPELLGALLHLSSLLYAPSGLSERFNLALFERTRVEEVREATRKGCEELHRRIPKEWNGRVERGWAAGRRLIAETARG